VTCAYCRAREAHEAVVRAADGTASSYRRIALKKSKAFWEQQMKRHGQCSCQELKEAV